MPTLLNQFQKPSKTKDPSRMAQFIENGWMEVVVQRKDDWLSRALASVLIVLFFLFNKNQCILFDSFLSHRTLAPGLWPTRPGGVTTGDIGLCTCLPLRYVRHPTWKLLEWEFCCLCGHLLSFSFWKSIFYFPRKSTILNQILYYTTQFVYQTLIKRHFFVCESSNVFFF